MRSNRHARVLSAIAALVLAASAQAASIDKPLADVKAEQTARAIFYELRCVVCEGQSLADSDAVLAIQMRAHVRRLLAEGKSETAVLAEFRERYGDAILMTPPLQSRTLLLWIAPLLLLLISGMIVWRITRPEPKEKDTA